MSTLGPYMKGMLGVACIALLLIAASAASTVVSSRSVHLTDAPDNPRPPPISLSGFPLQAN